MSSPPPPRGPVRPSTPDQTRPSISRTGSGSVAPKSEYLRNALQARRAQNTPTPLPSEMRAPPPQSSKRPEVKAASTSPDIFAEFALSEEQTAPVSPIRRRRPSEGGPPRSKTNRELTKEIETLKDSLMTSNMRVELLKKNNSELQHRVTELKEQVEELQPLEEENIELRRENNHYKLKMQDLEDELSQLRDDNDNLRKSNAEMLAINEECSSHWEDQELAVQEAADTIVALETEKAALAFEVKKLKSRVTALEDDTSHAGTLVDGSPRCPSRVYSIDESRPSTSHFDSDYFSQPDSPQAKHSKEPIKSSKESIISITPSERSKKFLDLTQERRNSARDLAKRMSFASLKALRIASPAPPPAVPEMPAKYQQQIPRIVEQFASDKRSSRTPKRYRDRKLPEQILHDALEISPELTPTISDASSHRSPTRQSESHYIQRPARPFTDRTSGDSRSTSRDISTPTISAQPRSRQPSSSEISPRVPSRMSSKHAHTSSSSEGLYHRDLKSQRDLRSQRQAEQEAEEWASIPPSSALFPARTSMASTTDLTSEADPSDKDRWWKSVDRIAATPQAASFPRQHADTAPPLRSAGGMSGDGQRSVSKATARQQSEYDLGRALFDGNEDVETFMRKTRR